jgi:ribose transport system ATP-binding protein
VNVEQDVLANEISSLSGGNQQKVVIGKWLLAGAKVLLLYDPTRGVDIGTKAEIYRLMHDLAERGVSILFYSTELSEVTHLSDRVLVLYKARVVAELDGAGITDESVLAAAVGRTRASSDD